MAKLERVTAAESAKLEREFLVIKRMLGFVLAAVGMP